MSEQIVTLPSGANVGIDVIGRASPEISTTTTADPGSAGTSLAVTSRSLFPQSGNFYIRVESEEMQVTGGQGTGAGSFTVVRAVNNTTAVAHAIGAGVAQVLGVQRVEPVFGKKQITFRGRAGSFVIPGRAGTTGQKLFSIFNSGPILVDLQKFVVDLNSTAAKLVQGPAVRVYKVTAAPTNGAAVTKNSLDSTLSSNSGVALLQDASADNTGATTTLTSTLTAGVILAQVFPSQAYTLVGFAPFDPFIFFPDEDEYVTLNANEGLVVMLDYTASTANPTTERWIVECAWYEYTNAA